MEQKQNGALAGLKVIDLSRVLGGPFCAQILGDHGADVIKVEPPQGDETRGWGPPFQEETASYYLGINRNKRGIAIDLTRPAGRELLLQLLADADVLVENFKTGTLEKWGLGYEETLSRRFPQLVHCRISGFGADGPLGGLPGYDAVIQAMAGLMSVNGESGGEPLRVGLPVVDMVTGQNAVIGILLALQERQRSGKGQFVEAALYDSGVSLLHPHLPNYFLSGKRPGPTGNAHPNIAPYDTYATRTGRIYLAVGNDGQFRKLCEQLGRPEMASDSRFVTNGARCAHRSELKQALEALLAECDCKPVAEQLIRSGVPCGPVLGVDEVVAHPHTAHRGMLVRIGDYQGTGAPVKLSRTPATYRLKPPAFGGQTREVFAELGIPEDALEALLKDGVIKAGWEL
ncbi:CaiB/BaiF CoA-transferase family protein [Undibacterium sp.]|uniref:CaiB/BaiF CoA transferase family protein n=1 Tax=Undibacterium sp. TaxID=1914977 RepID=UPI002B6E582E|nr:CaiB/BaiF CoA-transferase family protein [Undibacterium sp.]HTD05617.1 CaiB/BaiF CoA-transferase family protein [Undibacterium sp.]